MKAKMKKISALFLSCILLFSITACQKKRTAKEVMQSSLKQSSSLKDADFNGNASYTIETGKEGSQSTINFKMNFDTKLQTLKKDNLKMSMTSTINMLGQNINMTMYYADGYYYMNSNGTKQKMKMDIASLQKQIQSTTGQSTLPIKYYKDLKLSEDDGNNVIMSAITGGSDSIKITSMSGKKTLNDKDLPVKESIKMVIESNSNEVGKITLKMDLIYHNPGKSVTVSLPKDLNTYQEVSSNN